MTNNQQESKDKTSVFRKDVVHSYFCPKCGKPLRYNDCKISRRFGVPSRIACPACDVVAQHSGGMLIVTGLVVAYVGGFVIAFAAIAFWVGSGFCVVGAMRLGRQFRAAKFHKSKRELPSL